MKTVDEFATQMTEESQFYALLQVSSGELMVTYEDVLNWILRKTPTIDAYLYENGMMTQESVIAGPKIVASLIKFLKENRS